MRVQQLAECPNSTVPILRTGKTERSFFSPIFHSTLSQIRLAINRPEMENGRKDEDCMNLSMSVSLNFSRKKIKFGAQICDTENTYVSIRCQLQFRTLLFYL